MRKDKITHTMHRITQGFFLIVFSVFISCKKDVTPQIKSISQKEDVTAVAEINKSKILTIGKREEDFNQFFELFNQDSIFQVSRISFPLTVKINNEDYEQVDYIISKEEYNTLNLNIKTEYRDYKQKLILKKNKAIITQRGTNNGIFIDYIFEKRNGKWQLITWIDLST
jgi:hypothetical protein